MNLAQAVLRAEKISAALAPFCDRIQIAGSVRRRREWVNDLDFVVMLRPGQLAAFKDRVLQNSDAVKNGEEVFIVRMSDGLQVDFYFAHAPSADLLAPIPGNWGSVLLCRTGSKEHNVHLAQTAKGLGFKWETMTGVTMAVDFGGRTVLASETEEDIFKVLGLGFIAPERRER